MRTKALSVNQRIKVGHGYASLMGDTIAEIARVLRTVGLTLEIERAASDDKGVVTLYATRRPVTHDIATPKSPPSPVKVGGDRE